MEFDLDANNNSTDIKVYSLRPRCTPKTTEEEDSYDFQEVVQPRSRCKKASKQKKTLPLSKYRRKTANARERSRMREINEAFENLRRSIPLVSTLCDQPGEKNTKISTLRLAMKYITVLSSALKDSDGESDQDSVYSLTSSVDHSDFSASSLPNSFSVTTQHSSETVLQTSILPLEKSKYKATIVACVDAGGDRSVFRQLNERSSVTSSSSYHLSRLTRLEEMGALTTSFPHQLIELTDRGSSVPPLSLQFQPAPFPDEWENLNFSKDDFDDFLVS